MAFPASFNVKLATAGSSDTGDAQKFASVQETNRQNAIRKIRQEIWLVSKLTEPGVAVETLKNAALYLKDDVYTQINDERQIAELCAYPTCSNKPQRAYDSTGTPSLKLSGSRLINVKQTSQFCSNQCEKRSNWYRIHCLGVANASLLEELPAEDLGQTKSSSSPVKKETVPAPPTGLINPEDLVIVEKPIAIRVDPPNVDQKAFDAPSTESERVVPPVQPQRKYILGSKTKIAGQPSSKLGSEPEDEDEEDEELARLLTEGLNLRDELRRNGEMT